MPLRDTDTFLVSNGAASFQVQANNLLTSNQAGGMNIIVNEGPKSFRCPVGQLEQKDYKNAQGVDRILLVQRDGESFQVTLKELMDTYGNYARPGEEFYTNVSSPKLWTVPNGVRSISVLAVGGGGGGGAGYFAGAGGGGGALSYRTNIEVRPGQRFRLYAGAGGAATSRILGGIGGNGGESRIEQIGGPVIVSAGGGGGGQGSPYDAEGINPPPTGAYSLQGPFAGGLGGEGLSIAGQQRFKGGDGGIGAGSGPNNQSDRPGGGGAPGTYYKRGVSGRNSNGTGGLPAGTGGAAGGDNQTRFLADGGGGIGMYGPSNTATDYGNGGSGGQNESSGNGGNYGGGGGGQASDFGADALSGSGGQGAVRIIWPGTASFP